MKIIWALFGNDEDGIYGDLNWNPTQSKSAWIAIKWWFRNPLHNLFFHVLNVPKPFTSYGDYPTDVFSPVGGWNRVWRIGWNGKEYKFISYIGAIKFYIGWRERGNFGIKLTLNRRTA
jgi:hypothetical protein